MWRPGKRRAEFRASVSEVLRDDMLWRRQMLGARPPRKLRYGKGGGFAWHPRLLLPREKALSMGRGAVCAVCAMYADSSGSRVWGAFLGDAYIKAKWSKTEMREGINWKE